MLIKFAVTNYRGFADRIELDLSHPNNYTFNTFAIKDGVVKNGIIYGPNGCGKTNFSLAIFDIVNHLSQKWKKLNYYTNFKNAGSKDDAVRFEYTFNLGGTTLYYNYAKDKNGGLLTEKLSVGKDVVFDKTRDGIEIDETQFPIDAKVKDSLASNANQVSIVNYLLTSFPLAHDHYLIKLKDFVNSMLWFRCLDTREFIGLDASVTNIEEYIIKYDINEVIKKIKNSKIYTDEIQWGKLLEKEIETGIDIPQQCLDEYNQIRKEHNIENDSIEVWEEAMKNVFTKFTM